MHICIVYKNGETEVIKIKRFSDLSTDKSDFYYYETDHDFWGEGTTVRKSDILGIEIAPYPKADWPEETKNENPVSYAPVQKPAANQMETFLDNRPYK